MKFYTEWWGIVLVPETELEVTALMGVDTEVRLRDPEKPWSREANAESYYEEGTADWVHTPEEAAAHFRWVAPEDMPLPMGKALVLGR